jgi:hypothetical protein
MIRLIKGGCFMAICPLIQKDCLQDNCEWWSSGINKRGVIGLGVLLEGLHDMAAMAYQEFVGVVIEENDLEENDDETVSE